MEAQTNDLRDAVKSDDAARIRRATETLGATLQQIGQSAYGQQGQQPGTNDGKKPDEGVVEGEYRAM